MRAPCLHMSWLIAAPPGAFGRLAQTGSMPRNAASAPGRRFRVTGTVPGNVPGNVPDNPLSCFRSRRCPGKSCRAFPGTLPGTLPRARYRARFRAHLSKVFQSGVWDRDVLTRSRLSPKPGSLVVLARRPVVMKSPATAMATARGARGRHTNARGAVPYHMRLEWLCPLTPEQALGIHVQTQRGSNCHSSLHQHPEGSRKFAFPIQKTAKKNEIKNKKQGFFSGSQGVWKGREGAGGELRQPAQE